MTNPNWSDKEIELLKSTRTNAEIGKILGRTEGSVRAKRHRLKLGSPKAVLTPAETTVDEDAEKARLGYWKAQHDALKSKYDKVLKQGAAVEQLVEMAASLAPQSYSPAPAIPTLKSHTGKPQSAVLMLTDTHVGATVSPRQTLGFGGYNFEIFLRRLKFLESGVESILTGHVSTAVPELVVCLGGDMINGNLNHGGEAAQTTTLFQQFYGGGHAIAQFLRNVSRLVPKVRIYTAVGNHPRWGTQHKMPTDNRYSNLDHFLYAYIQALTKDLSSVEWTLNAQPFAIFDVQNFWFHLSHGDHLRGGDKALGIPNHAVARMVASTSALYGKNNLPSPHYYLVGHLHRSIALPHARGSVVINGGFPGLDGYGLMSGFNPVDPSQTLFLVHPKFGKTATFEIQLKHAPSDGPTPYEIPSCGEPIQ